MKASRARSRHPLGRAAGGAPAPRGATVPRERSYKQLVARQGLPSKENSWRFRIGLAYIGESALPTGQRELSWCTAFFATSHGLGMTLEMTLVYPVQWGVAIRRTRLTPCASPFILLGRYFSCHSRNYYLGILPRRKKFSKTRNKMMQVVNFP